MCHKNEISEDSAMDNVEESISVMREVAEWEETKG